MTRHRSPRACACRPTTTIHCPALCRCWSHLPPPRSSPPPTTTTTQTNKRTQTRCGRHLAAACPAAVRASRGVTPAAPGPCRPGIRGGVCGSVTVRGFVRAGGDVRFVAALVVETAYAQPQPQPQPHPRDYRTTTFHTTNSPPLPLPASPPGRVKEAAGRVDMLVLCAAIAGKPYKLSPQVKSCFLPCGGAACMHVCMGAISCLPACPLAYLPTCQLACRACVLNPPPHCRASPASLRPCLLVALPSPHILPACLPASPAGL